MKRLMLQLAMVPILATGALMARPAPAHASCTQNYYVCLNGAVQEWSFFARQLEEVECGFDYVACMAAKVRV